MNTISAIKLLAIFGCLSLVGAAIVQPGVAQAEKAHTHGSGTGHQHGKKNHMKHDGSKMTHGHEMTHGHVKRINKGSKKVTIKHGEIKNLDMPPMTMVFRVADETMLDALKKGDKIRFTAEDRDGAMVITAFERAK